MNLLSSMRYLVALNEQKHFGRAALACHITQPALSNAIKALEAELGVTIVKRDRQFAGLTREGQQVLASSQLILREQALLVQELQSSALSAAGDLRIGAVPTAMSVATAFAASLQGQHKALTPKVYSMNSDHLEAGLGDLSLDMALGYTGRIQMAQGKLSVWPQYHERYFLLRQTRQTGTASGMQLGPSMAWRDAASLPLCLLTHDMHNRSVMDAAFLAAGVHVTPAMEVNASASMPLCVQEGDLCAVMPSALLGGIAHLSNFEALPLIEPDLSTPVGFMTHATARPSRALDAAIAWLGSPAWRTKVLQLSAAGQSS